ncbi:MAG TPA: helix-hairpin-helix domain-containing protein, partial [Bryobacteraceae bacterium]|nr:helix-hairpin-helix domain-containing protein [Bryobacteraceae bacterium]
MENREFARILYETADLMEIAGEDSFRIRSYRNGASAIESYPERVTDILANPERKLAEIPGIGKGLAAVLREVGEHGTFDKRDELLQKFPAAALEFLKIEGLGPKTIALLFEHFRIQTMDELEQLCRENKLRTLPRLGAKVEEKVLRSICQHKE